MNCLVTGAAGFIGSHLSRQLLANGHVVTGLDCFTDFYPRWIKERNVASLVTDKNFTFWPRNILDLEPGKALRGIDVVFHLAAQAGVRTSWGDHFSVYIQNNIWATQRLLEEAKSASLRKFIYASSSSVYGLTPTLPMSENAIVRPLSPYGVTKLAAEQLCFLYYKSYEIPAVSLRFFTVYGPGQRPDMAFHRFFKAIAEGKPITVYGDGTQTRDFTYVDDIIDACFQATERGRPGEVYNIGGGHRERLDNLLPLLEAICGKNLTVVREEKQKGDVLHTLADIAKSKDELGYAPRTAIEDGLREEWNWVRGLYGF
ncbi:MAG: NAD-dependent epimerase/dehydratase family protein [Clostridiales bacterium]|nr:NAD-dependent epimerase/dehydratase family protein [Clostridiales bacterium]